MESNDGPNDSLPDADSRYRTAERYIETKNWTAAKRELEEALRLDPEHYRALWRYGVVVFQLGDRKESERFGRQALARNPEHIDSLMLLGLLLKEKKPKKAREFFLKAREVRPTSALCWERYADFCRDHGTKKEKKTVQSLYEEGMRLDPTDADIPAKLAEYLFTLDRREAEAVGYAKQALEINADHPRAHLLMARMALFEKRIDDALEHVRTALRQDPTDVRAIEVLVLVKTRQKFLFGLWWRYNYWFQYRITGWVRAILCLFLWVLLKPLFLLVLVYMLIADRLLERMVKKELEGVKLTPNF